MKYFYLLPFLIFSCSNQKEKYLIELNEKNVIIQRQNEKLKLLEDELANCKLNYDALDKATN
ncbi:Uncharacterised protein [Algoriella xinjiangensis]|uniref:hypothetical protein n=1 Tax=Algoriella xinjiangensis TaxID=684065 RepID=UPI000F639356|nr:hypothetical protein [Algoriella xinjiangensis]VDH16696.1 Uncharacterised protein [Algoriella xinjiangensis]